MLPGSTQTVENSQCRIDGASSSVTNSGMTQTLTFALFFKSAFAGLNNISALVETQANQLSPTHVLGSWIVSRPAVVASTLDSAGQSGHNQSMIRVLIVSVLAVILFYVGSHRRLTRFQLIFVLLFFACGAVLAIKPEEANVLAEAVGVGRGADLLLYFSVLGGIYGSASFYFRIRYNEQLIITIVRKLAVTLPEHDEASTAQTASPEPTGDRP
jgi:hypothetical protein